MATTTTGAALLRPEQVAELVVRPVTQKSQAMQVATVVTTSSKDFRFPVISGDPLAAFVTEGAEITPSEPTIEELIVTPAKVAGLVPITRELADDSSPAAADAVGDRLANDIAARVDQTFFSTVAAPAPAGLADLTGITAITTPAGQTSWADLDVFASAISAAEQEGAQLTSFCAHPDDWEALAKLKVEDTSRAPLLGLDATSATSRRILGVPLIVSKWIAPGTVWGLDAAKTFVVVREDSVVEADRSVYFNSDRVAVRGIMRLAHAYPHPAAVVKISLATA